jgi:hypothetical protein
MEIESARDRDPPAGSVARASPGAAPTLAAALIRTALDAPHALLQAAGRLETGRRAPPQPRAAPRRGAS